VKKLNIHKQLTLMLFLSILSISLVYADAFSEGEKFFKENKPEQAIPFFEQALLMENVSPNVYNFLGLSYYQIGKYQQSLDVFVNGTTKDGTNKRILYYNAGNTAFAMGNFSLADQYFSFSYAADNNFSSALLNRANTKMKLDQLQNASDDYTQYLIIEPNSPQRPEIERMIALISGELRVREEQKLARELEEQRLKEEQARIAAEMEKLRIEQEKQAAIEAERRKKLLEDIAASLQSADSTNVSAGTDGVMEYEYESELD
jgi:tetratricopeptide (TPR) repeat protein